MTAFRVLWISLRYLGIRYFSWRIIMGNNRALKLIITHLSCFMRVYNRVTSKFRIKSVCYFEYKYKWFPHKSSQNWLLIKCWIVWSVMWGVLMCDCKSTEFLWERNIHTLSKSNNLGTTLATILLFWSLSKSS